MRSLLPWVTVSLAMALLLAGSPALAQKKVALVIGNSAYKEQPLKNPANDARAMAAKLKAIGFQVIARENATKTQMERAVADFGEALSSGAIGLFYYAGHGLQVAGRNFLVPVDASITSEQRVRLETVDVDVVLDQMEAARSDVNLVILDACRNNPFERRFRAAGGGLAQINAPQGTLIAYATAPGKVAADGDGANGLYTSKLLQHLGTPGVPVEEVFKRVRIEVARETANGQTPWESSSLTGNFFFVEPKPVAAALPPNAAPPPPPAPSIDKEALFWQSVQNSDDADVLSSYLTQFPSGTFVPAAKAKIAAIERRHKELEQQRQFQLEARRKEQEQQQQKLQVAAAPAPAAAPDPAPAVIHPTPVAAPPPAAAGPRAVTPTVDGVWQGVYACGPSGTWGLPAFTSSGRVFEVHGGKLTGRFTPNTGGAEEYSGTLVAGGTVTIQGEGSNPRSHRPYNISMSGKVEGDRFTAKGRHGDRDCTLDFRKVR